MYQNKLSELIDAMKKPGHIAASDEVFQSKHFEKIKMIFRDFEGVASGAICFQTHFEDIPDCAILPEMMRLPYQKIWLEIHDGNDVAGFFCRETEYGIQILNFGKSPATPWIFVGIYTVKTVDGNAALLCNVGSMDDDSIKQNFTMYSQFLSALNCCNITRTEHKPKPSQQSVRRALGRQPLFSTWTLEIDLERTERELPGESSGGHTSKRLHLCRGHARQHKPGQWCWVRAHVRGDKSLGMIHKDYVVH